MILGRSSRYCSLLERLLNKVPEHVAYVYSYVSSEDFIVLLDKFHFTAPYNLSCSSGPIHTV